MLLTTDLRIVLSPLGGDRLAELVERLLVCAVVHQILGRDHYPEVLLVVVPLPRHLAAVPDYVDDRRPGPRLAEEVLGLPDAFPAVPMPPVVARVLREQLVHPAVDVLVPVAQQPLAVPAMVVDLGHNRVGRWSWWDSNPQAPPEGPRLPFRHISRPVVRPRSRPKLVRTGGLEPPWLLTARLSTWCVCQFHHARKLWCGRGELNPHGC